MAALPDRARGDGAGYSRMSEYKIELENLKILGLGSAPGGSAAPGRQFSSSILLVLSNETTLSHKKRTIPMTG